MSGLLPNCKCGKEGKHEVDKMFANHFVKVYYCDSCHSDHVNKKRLPPRNQYYGCVK